MRTPLSMRKREGKQKTEWRKGSGEQTQPVSWGRVRIKQDWAYVVQAECLTGGVVPHGAALGSISVSQKFPASPVGAQLCEALRLGSLKWQLLLQDHQERRGLHTQPHSLGQWLPAFASVSTFSSSLPFRGLRECWGSDGAWQPSSSFWLALPLTTRCFIYLCDVTTNRQCQQCSSGGHSNAL